MNEQNFGMAPVQPRRSGLVGPILIGCAAFAIGVGATVGYVQWQSQQAKIAEMAKMLEEMQNADNTVTRAEAVDLVSTTSVARPSPSDTQVETPQVVAAAPAQQPAPAEEISTADQLQSLLDQASDPLVSAEIAKSEKRRETMSVAIKGVNELVKAALLGNYEITSEKDGDKEVLRIWFPQKLIEQVRLEQVLSLAATEGMIAVSDSLKSSNGVYDGRTILFDLVERALSNGTDEERRLAAKIQNETVALLATLQPTAAQTTVSSEGQRFYTVQSGDSLAYIALQVYGNTNAYLSIFDANRDQLSSPERIQIGQRLLLPQI